MQVKTERCLVCEKSVYALERLAADGKIFHKGCFKCSECKKTLALGSYASMDSRTFCKPCFKKLFFSKGNYSEGFGQLKPQAQHELKKNQEGGSPGVSPLEMRRSASSEQLSDPRKSPELVRQNTPAILTASNENVKPSLVTRNATPVEPRRKAQEPAKVSTPPPEPAKVHSEEPIKFVEVEETIIVTPDTESVVANGASAGAAKVRPAVTVHGGRLVSIWGDQQTEELWFNWGDGIGEDLQWGSRIPFNPNGFGSPTQSTEGPLAIASLNGVLHVVFKEPQSHLLYHYQFDNESNIWINPVVVSQDTNVSYVTITVYLGELFLVYVGNDDITHFSTWNGDWSSPRSANGAPSSTAVDLVTF